MSTAASTDSPHQHPLGTPTAPGGLDAFVSYSRQDQRFVIRLKQALERRGRNVWIDADDIPPGAPWRRELGTGIEAANSFVFIISPASVASAECGEELKRATELGKRLVPVLYHEADRVPDALASLQYVEIEEAEFERSVERLDEAITTDHEWVREHTQWLARALRWDDGGRESSRLLRGTELAAAERWLARQAEGKQPAPTPLQVEYIVAGRHAERRRLRIVVAATLLALAVSSVLAVLAILSRNEAIEQRDQARSRELAGNAVGQLDVDPELSLLLSLEAVDIARNPTSVDALRQALMGSHVRAEMRGSRSWIEDLSMTRDGRRLVTASRDHTARVFDTASGRPLQVLRHGGPVETAAFSPQGNRIVTASDDGTARLWRVADGRQLAVFRHDGGGVNSAAFSPDGKRIVTAGDDGTVRIWDVDAQRQVAILRKNRAAVRSAIFDPHGKKVLTAGRDGTARLWDPGSGRSSILARHDHGLSTATFSANGRVAVTLDDGGTVKIWDPASGRKLSQLSATAFGVAISPDGKSILTTTIDGPAYLWDSETGARTAQLIGHGSPVDAAAFSPDGTLAATGGSDTTARVWNVEQGSLVAVLKGPPEIVNRVAFTPDGASVVTGGGEGTVRRWDIGAGLVLRPQSDGVIPAPLKAVPGPDGRTVLTASQDATVRLWNAKTGREIMHRRECGLPSTSEFSCLTVAAGTRHLGPIEAADISPDGKRVATAGDRGTAFVFDTVSGRQIAALHGHGHYLRIDDIAFSPDGHRIITAGEDGTARLWNARSGDQLQVLRGHRMVYAATFIPHTRRVATANADGTVRIWGPDGRPQRTFRLEDSGGVLDVAASPDGRYLVAPEGDTARVWDDETGRTVTRLRGHDGFVFSAAFSPDGRSLVTGGEDLTARVWEFPSGRQLGVLRGHSGYLISAAFAPDGDAVVTGSRDGTARVFPCDVCGSVDTLIRRARERTTRSLSREERARFLTFGG